MVLVIPLNFVSNKKGHYSALPKYSEFSLSTISKPKLSFAASVSRKSNISNVSKMFYVESLFCEIWLVFYM